MCCLIENKINPDFLDWNGVFGVSVMSIPDCSTMQTDYTPENTLTFSVRHLNFIDYPQYTKGTGYTGNPQNNHSTVSSGVKLNFCTL